MSASAKNGFELFQDKAKCAVCHMGYNFTDNGFHNIGVKTEGAPDVGPLRAESAQVHARRVQDADAA